MQVLGIDPGKRQTWYASLHFSKKESKGQFVPVWGLKETGHLDLNPDNPLNDRIKPTRDLLESLVSAHRPDLVVAERYIVRPGYGRGNNSEAINVMIGLLYAVCNQLNIDCWLVMPNTWKTWWSKTFARSWYDHWPQLNVHQADACTLGIYGCCAYPSFSKV